MKSKTIAIIPARGGSKRLLNKNRLLLGAYPLLVHSILYAQANKNIIDEIYVSTDNVELKAIALHYGAQVFDRPAALSGDLEPTITALQHVLASITDVVAHVVVLQPTNPLRPTHLLRECMQKYQEAKADSLFTVSRHHQKLGKIIGEKFHPFNYQMGQRSQDLEPLYFENGLLYISQADLIRKGTLVSPTAFPFIVEHPYAHVDIDTQEDLDYAVFLLGR